VAAVGFIEGINREQTSYWSHVTLASRALIDMGYTHVFDFGGILDWQGEIMVIP